MKYYTTADAAAALGVARTTIKYRIRTGIMQAERAGERVYLIPASEVERFQTISKKLTDPAARAKAYRRRAPRARARKERTA